jgi:ATP-binding cassette subfamily B protein
MSQLVARKLSESAAQLRLLPRALKLVRDAARGWTAAWIAMLIAQGLLPALTVWLARPLVNRLLDAVRGGDIRPVIAPAAAIAAAAIAAEVLRAACGWVRAVQAELVQDHIAALVHRKSAEADLAFYDSPDFFDHLHRARMEAAYRPVALVETLGSLVQNGITLAAMLGLLFSFGPWMPLTLMAGTAPALWVALRYSVRQHELRVRTTSDERRTWYFEWLLTSREAAAEVRLFGLGARFRAEYARLRERLRGGRIELARDNMAAEAAAGLAALAVAGGSAGWMLWRAVRGAATFGDLALFHQAFQNGLSLIRALLGDAGQLYYNSLFLGNLFEFLALESRVASPERPAALPDGGAPAIRFRGVTFRYPGSDHAALRGFDVALPAGRISAIVGPNGAGKSTLIRLLCRFYDPGEGAVELDGTDLRRLAVDDVRRRIAVLFQEPVRYNTTAEENIALGAVEARPGAEAIERAGAAAGADQIAARFPRGYRTVLGKTFSDGVELSTGEWQRIALARAFLRDAPVLVLDEPTSAMDPWAEADWLDRFRAFAAGRTAILITHRFTTAMRADEIFVVDGGEIVERGSHEELLSRGGLYAQSWARQTAGVSG